MKPIKPMKPISITRRHPPVSLSKQAVGCASSPQFQVPTCYCDIGQVAGRRITAGQGNTVPQDATQNSFFDFMAEPWLLPKRGDHENKWLNIIGFDRRKDFAQPARPPIHPTFTPCVGTSQPSRFLSETFATYDRARRGRPPGNNDNKLLNIIGFDRWKNFARTAPPPPTTHHPPPTPTRYNEPLLTPHAQMIQLTGAAKRFGPKTLFENLDWLVTPNERAGIVGANGTGKSTLLKILAGIDGLDAGSITVMKGASVGYLPQEGLSLSGRTVFAECMTVFADLLALEQEQETLAHKLSELDPASPEYAQVADRFHRAEGEFRARDGFAIEAQVGMVLSGLGFPQRQWTRRTEDGH